MSISNMFNYRGKLAKKIGDAKIETFEKLYFHLLDKIESNNLPSHENYLGDNDLADACLTAVVNKRGGGMGLISGRKAFQRPMNEGIKLLNTIQDVYLCDEVDVA